MYVNVGSPILYCILETETLCIVEASHGGGEITFTVWEAVRECVPVSAWTLIILVPISVFVHYS